MVKEDKYKSYLEQIPLDIEKCISTGKRHIFGYTSNLDVLIKWDTSKINSIIEKYLKEEPSIKEGETIDSMEDFARIISYYSINGLGTEVDITNIEVCETLEKNFDIELSLGGTGAQGAAAMNSIGFPVIAHLTDKSKEVCKVISNPDFSIVNNEGLISITGINTGQVPIRHMILQYSKGDKIFAMGKEYTVPLSNRIIMDYDKVHKYVPIDKKFLDYCEENAQKIYSYNISGFNAIIDIDILKERLMQLVKHYKIIKEKNPECVLYLESAHYLNTKSKMLVFKEMSQCIDILGMNEEELVELTGQFGIKTEKENLGSILKGLGLLTDYYGVNGIVLHTKDYSMFYGNEIKGVNIEKGLTLGNLMSCTRARIGCYGSYNDCAESLKLNLSDIGVAFRAELNKISVKKSVCLVPARYMEHPKCTIGLGDTFVAGMQTCFTR